MSAELQVELDQPQQHFATGDTVKGRVILNVAKEHISVREITLRILCDIDVSFSAASAPSDRQPRLIKSKLRVYEGAQSLRPQNHRFTAGRHEIPFAVVLPDNTQGLPPSVTQVVEPNTYGHITFRIKAQAKRHAWLGFNEIKGDTDFLFMPTSFVNGEELASGDVRREPFNDIVQGQIQADRKLMDRLMRREPKEQPPLEIQGIFSHPEVGLVQQHTPRLGLKIQNANKYERVVAKNLVISLESWLVLGNEQHKNEYLVKSRPISEDMLIRAGTEIDLSDIASKGSVPLLDAPTFTTEIMSLVHRLRVELTVSRESTRNKEALMTLTHGFPARVLSFFLKDSRTGKFIDFGNLKTAAGGSGAPPREQPMVDAKLARMPPGKAAEAASQQPYTQPYTQPYPPQQPHKEEQPSAPQQPFNPQQTYAQEKPGRDMLKPGSDVSQPGVASSSGTNDASHSAYPQDDPPDYHEATR